MACCGVGGDVFDVAVETEGVSEEGGEIELAMRE